MFSGIVECTGIVKKIKNEGSNKHITIRSDISNSAYIDQSIAHHGVCLTVVSVSEDTHTVTAIAETLAKTNLNDWAEGDMINLERSVMANSRMDGHFVQGHVDTVALCTDIKQVDGSWYFYFSTDAENCTLMVPKGSVCINGVSLTIVDVEQGNFSVAIIPYTYQHTQFRTLEKGQAVNIEFDILGKYIVNYIKKVNLT